MAATRKGYVFEHEVERGLDLFVPYYFKIPDTKMVGFINSILKKQGMGQITFPKIPADYICHTASGKTYYLECKATDSGTFHFENIRPHQLVEGYTINHISTGLEYLFVIHMKKYKRVFLVSPDLIWNLQKIGRASISLNEFEAATIEIPRLTESKHPQKLGAFIDFSKSLV
jgi:penicillin-binding protein-related factor A (putative recombinase)